MLRAYRLTYPDSPHALPQLWEWQQPYIEHLLTNARTCGRRAVQRYFRDWDAYARENAHIWQRVYFSKPLSQHLASWELLLAEYRLLVMDVQAIYEEACRTAPVGLPTAMRKTIAP